MQSTASTSISATSPVSIAVPAPALLAAFACVPDPRRRQGTRYPSSPPSSPPPRPPRPPSPRRLRLRSRPAPSSRDPLPLLAAILALALAALLANHRSLLAI